MRRAVSLLICLLVAGVCLGEESATAGGDKLEEKTALYVCSQKDIEGNPDPKLVKFDSQTGEKVIDLLGVDQPVDVAIGPNDDFFVTDEAPGASNVRRFNHLTGEADAEPYGKTGPYLSGPKGLAFGPDNHLYVVDMGAVVGVVEFDENGEYVRELPTAIVPEDPENPALADIEDVGCDGSGNLYVTQWYDEWYSENPGVYKFTGSGWVLFGQTNNLVNPYGLTFGPDGDLYVAEDRSTLSPPEASGVYRYNGATGAFKEVFGATGSGSNLVSPRYLTFGSDGDLYVTNEADGSVRKFSGPFKPDAGAFKGVFGQTGGNVAEPYGLVFGSAGAPPERPQLAIQRLEDGKMLLTLTGTQGKSYQLRYSEDVTVSDFTNWTLGGIITLEGKTTDSWTDDTAGGALRRFYKGGEQ